MATATTQSVPSLDEAAHKAADISDKLVAGSKKISKLYLDSCDTAVAGFVAFEKQLAAQTPNDVVKSLINSHAEVTRELAKTYTTIARETLA